MFSKIAVFSADDSHQQQHV